jgi:predicted phosphodiesterase
MKLRYISDIHLEFIKPNKLKTILQKITQKDDEILILAGDIGNPYSENYDNFMKHVNENFTKTFVIAGNHEYYGNYLMEDTEKHLEKYFQQHKNISFLDNKIEKYNGINFLGTTLWSNISKPEYEINDVYNIPNFDYKKYNKLNKKCIDFMETAIQDDAKYVIITHHQPSQSLIHEKYKTAKMSPYNQWFYCDMDEFIKQNNHKILAWIYGHTHTPLTTYMYNVPMCCNPIGYPNENPINDYTKNITLSINDA